MKKRDLTAQRFHRLLVMSEVPERKNGRIMWLCRCDCGAIVRVAAGALTSGNTQSCGCQKIDKTRQRCVTHGMSKDPVYAVWCSMKARCEKRSCGDFRLYGARGIKVCERWKHSFAAFLQDMGPRPGDGFSVDRINNDGDYCPENCRWASSCDQASNKRTNTYLTIDGETKILSEWAKYAGITVSGMCRRIKRGGRGRDLIRPPHAVFTDDDNQEQAA